MTRRFGASEWYDSSEFIQIAKSFQIDRIAEARKSILREKKSISHGKIISELSFGFWTSLFDKNFEKTLWKNLRFVFPDCPKQIRQRKSMSSKLNGIRKLRNRIFHHEAITWNLDAIINYRNEIYDGIKWLDKDIVTWFSGCIDLDETIAKQKELIRATGYSKK